jgi:hypothetical protein
MLYHVFSYFWILKTSLPKGGWNPWWQGKNISPCFRQGRCHRDDALTRTLYQAEACLRSPTWTGWPCHNLGVRKWISTKYWRFSKTYWLTWSEGVKYTANTYSNSAFLVYLWYVYFCIDWFVLIDLRWFAGFCRHPKKQEGQTRGWCLP